MVGWKVSRGQELHSVSQWRLKNPRNSSSEWDLKRKSDIWILINTSLKTNNDELGTLLKIQDQGPLPHSDIFLSCIRWGMASGVCSSSSLDTFHRRTRYIKRVSKGLQYRHTWSWLTDLFTYSPAPYQLCSSFVKINRKPTGTNSTDRIMYLA